MAGIKNQPGEKENPLDFDRKTIKKIFYGGNLFFIGVGFLILLIMFFVAWDFIDKTEKLVKGIADDTCDTLTTVEETLLDAETEVVLLGGTIGGMESSMTALSDGIGEAGSALRSVDDSLAVLQTVGVSLGDEIGTAADDLENASASLSATAGGFSEHEENINEISSDLSDIRTNVASQKQTVCNQKNIIEIFDSMRLTVIILFVLAAVLIFLIFINSAAGML